MGDMHKALFLGKFQVGSGGGGTSDYEDLANKPSINGNQLTGNKTTAQLGIIETKIKAKTYTGTGTNTNAIEFDEKPLCILSIDGYSTNTDYISVVGFRYGVPMYTGNYKTNSGGGTIYGSVAYSNDNLTMTLTASDAGAACNYSGKTYTVLYIPDTEEA